MLKHAALTSRATAFGNGITSAKTADAAKQAAPLKDAQRAGVLTMLTQMSAVV